MLLSMGNKMDTYDLSHYIKLFGLFFILLFTSVSNAQDRQLVWADEIYDIMEHPTNEVTTIYGTIHSETYNSFTGIGPAGGTTEIADAETAFHVYAIEWNEDQIDFYVDDQLYFSFRNDQKGSSTWPFNRPFYIILNLAAIDRLVHHSIILEIDIASYRLEASPKKTTIKGKINEREG